MCRFVPQARPRLHADTTSATADLRPAPYASKIASAYGLAMTTLRKTSGFIQMRLQTPARCGPHLGCVAQARPLNICNHKMIAIYQF